MASFPSSTRNTSVRLFFLLLKRLIWFSRNSFPHFTRRFMCVAPHIALILLLSVFLAAPFSCFTSPAKAGTLSFTNTNLSPPDGGDQRGVLQGGVVSVSGDTAVVGAYLDDASSAVDAGAVYVYGRGTTGWTQKGKITASDGVAHALFGYSVALSGDTLLVGAPFADTPTDEFAGAVYVFNRQGNTWTQSAKLFLDDASFNDFFGFSVALSGDVMVAGAYGDGSGAAHVFTRSNGIWTYTARLEGGDTSGAEYFGWSVAAYDDTIVVGAPGAGVNSRRYAGGAYVFTRQGDTWASRAALSDPLGAAYDLFGHSVAIYEGQIVVGAPGVDADRAEAGAAYVFAGSGAIWSQNTKLTVAGMTRLGWSVALSANTLVAGARGITGKSGQAAVYTRVNGAWAIAAQLPGDGGGPGSTSGDNFGWTVAAEGTVVMVGSLKAGGGVRANGILYESPGLSTGHIVTNTLDSGPGSLCNALLYANSHPGTKIIFRIPGSDPGFANGLWAIRLQSALPPITAQGTVIDGGSQALFAGNTSEVGPEIFLDGSQAGDTSGLLVQAKSGLVKALALGNFTRSGIVLESPASSFTVQSCFLGCDGRGVAAPNGVAGLTLSSGTTLNVIGGVAARQANRFAYNQGAGVEVVGNTTIRNTIRGNEIFGNGGLGINLVGGSENAFGVTANDAGDSDVGPNGLQNCPLLTKVATASNRTSAYGTLNGAPNMRYAIDLYCTPSTTGPDPSGYGEGQLWCGSTNILTDGSGLSSFQITATTPAEGTFTLTATDLNTNSTGEFGPALASILDEGKPQLIVDAPLDGSTYGTLSQATGHASDGGSGLRSVTCRLYRSAWGGAPAGWWNWTTGLWQATSVSTTVQTANGWVDWNQPLPSLATGTYSFFVAASDWAGNLEEKAQRFTIGANDTTPPDLWIDAPAVGAENGGLAAARGRAADSLSGVAVVRGFLYRYASQTQTAGYWDWTAKSWVASFTTNAQQTATTSNGFATWSFPLPSLPVGTYAVGAIVKDSAGNTTQRQVEWTAGPDVTKPIVFLDEPANNTNYTSLTTARGRASDSGSGVARVACQVYRFATSSYPVGYWDWALGVWNNNGNSYQDATTTDGWANWSLTLPTLAPGGEYKVRVVAFDVAKNSNSSVVAQFRIVAAAAASVRVVSPTSSFPASASSAVRLSSASMNAVRRQIILSFSAPLGRGAATNSLYTVIARSHDGSLRILPIESVRLLSNGSDLALTLPAGSWPAGEEIQVSWQNMPDAAGLTFSGLTAWLKG